MRKDFGEPSAVFLAFPPPRDPLIVGRRPPTCVVAFLNQRRRWVQPMQHHMLTDIAFKQQAKNRMTDVHPGQGYQFISPA